MTYEDLEWYRALKKKAVCEHAYAMQDPYSGWSPDLDVFEALIRRFERAHRDIRPLSFQVRP